ncbi:MAG: hypothetical protein AAB740_00225 [Patescibacteria group bacterium]
MNKIGAFIKSVFLDSELRIGGGSEFSNEDVVFLVDFIIILGKRFKEPFPLVISDGEIGKAKISVKEDGIACTFNSKMVKLEGADKKIINQEGFTVIKDALSYLIDFYWNQKEVISRQEYDLLKYKYTAHTPIGFRHR